MNHTHKKMKVHEYNESIFTTDSLLFKDRSFSCTLDLIDLVKQIQSFQKGWTLKPDVLVKQSKMFHFWTLKSIISQKSVTC